MDSQQATPQSPASGRSAIVAGFGMPGRAAAETLAERGLRVTVIELNDATVRRCTQYRMVLGDASDPQTLVEAGVEQASVFVVAVPSDPVALRITREVHKANPAAHLVTRCHYVSTGMEARRCGAHEVIVAEHVLASAVADVLARTVHELPSPASPL
jgi:CPA2 family monovalent cation:H+ antiporter-2